MPARAHDDGAMMSVAQLLFFAAWLAAALLGAALLFSVWQWLRVKYGRRDQG
jgi:hypothetical protein